MSIYYRRHRKRIGTRPYKNYSDETLNLAVDMVKNKQISSYEAEKRFGIPRRTIDKKVQNLHSNKPGHPFRLTEEEELKFTNVLIAASNFGYPLTELDLRLVVFDYLKKNNKVHLFNNKLPGRFWVKRFLARHQDKLNFGVTRNINKKAQPERSLQELQLYFENLKTSLTDVPSSNILNYYDVNLNDNLKSAQTLYQKEVRDPERDPELVNRSKECISTMFSGTADGELLPPYVIYKSECMWNNWCDGGPQGAQYNRTQSGWFDSATFLDWFHKIIIPWARKLDGKKVIIGDKLSSHINVDVIELCNQHNIAFVLIPPNSTRLTQPLDVSFFIPLKQTWRKILLKYKVENPKQTSLNKCHFPLLLNQLIEGAGLNKKDNIIRGFQSTGICPYDPETVCRKLGISMPFMDIPEDPFKDIPEPSAVINSEDEIKMETDSDASNISCDYYVIETLDDVENVNKDDVNVQKNDENIKMEDLIMGQYILVQLKSIKNTVKYYVAQIRDVLEDQGVEIKFMRSKKNEKFYWPIVDDISVINISDIITILPSPQERRGYLYFDFKFSYKIE